MNHPLLNQPIYRPRNVNAPSPWSRAMNRLACVLLNTLKDPTQWPAPDGGVRFTTTESTSTLRDDTVELSVEFNKDVNFLHQGFVTYFISGQAVMCNDERTRIENKFELRISITARNFTNLVAGWDNIGWNNIQKWMKVQSVVNYNAFGEKRTVDDALSIARQLVPSFAEMNGARTEIAWVDSDGEDSDDDYPWNADYVAYVIS